MDLLYLRPKATTSCDWGQPKNEEISAENTPQYSIILPNRTHIEVRLSETKWLGWVSIVKVILDKCFHRV